MQKALFIADLHLDPTKTHLIDLFLQFLENQQADALYILGDFFEYWIGDDDIPAPAMQKVIAGLENTTMPLYFMHGNRDFLVGDTFCQKIGCTLLSEPYIIDLFGKKTLLLHGDSLCTEDIAHQQFRAMVLNPAWQQEFLSKSLEERHMMAQMARQKSQANYTSENIIDINPEALIALIQQYQVEQIIHGHTHQQAIHELIVDNKLIKRMVLGDWKEKGNFLQITSEEANFYSI